VHVSHGDSAEIVNGGTINGFIQVEGNLLLTGTNGIYITNDLQALAGTVTVDTKSIAEITGSTEFDGIFEAKGPGAVVDLGGAGGGLIVNIATIEGPPLVPTGWTELTFNDPSAQINEWNGKAYVSVETTLTDIKGRGTVDVLAGRNYTTTNTLTVEAGAAGSETGMLNLQAGTVTTGGIDINGGLVQGYATIVGGVINDGTLMALGGTLDLTGSLTGTGTVAFDHDTQQGTLSAIGATLEVNSVSAGQTITMNGDDTLHLDTPAAFAGTIAAKIGDQIVLQGVTATGAVLTNGTLVVSDGTQTVASLDLSGDYTGDNFVVNGSTLQIAAKGTSVTPTEFAMTDTTTGVSSTAAGTPYSGPVAGLQWEYITTTTDSLAIAATAPNVFIHTGSGDDAIDVSRVNGNNVLDGSTGSNFLVGGSGDDTFFVDDRGPASPIWDTVANFHSGDAATIWGVTPGDFDLSWVNGQGATGYTGLTLHATAPGVPTASLTLAGFTTADLTNGRLTVSFGTTAATDGAPGSAYMYVHAT